MESSEHNANKDCPICFDTIENFEGKNKTALKLNDVSKSLITLKCGHYFHHDCLVDWLINKNKKSYHSIPYCPYCRKNFDYVPLPKNMFPIKYIHEEFNLIQTYIDNKDIRNLEKSCNELFNQNHCNTLLKTGKHKGYQCSRKKTKDSNMCKLHFSKYKDILSIFK